jgi:ABC-type Na+ efflux pump permease subunit
MVATEAAPACGRTGARKVANQAAAIEVIKRGGDRFVIAGQNTDSRVTGGYYNRYSGYQSYNTNEQGLVVQMLSKGQAGYENSLSARQLLGSDWQKIVDEGIPATC